MLLQTRVLVDANVLFSRTQRDWLFQLALEGEQPLYHGYWSEDILAETISRLRDKHPGWSGGQITAVRKKVEEIFPHGCVEEFDVDGTFLGADAGDKHVHAAAKACSADIVLTTDVSGLLAPGQDPDLLPYEIYKPDDFFVLVDDSAPERVQAVTRAQIAYWMNKRGQACLYEYLVKSECPEFAQRVQAYQDRIERWRS